ncbi:MAG: MFS transporter [Clostridia bacterium]|nr:MFS transporter [Clostridia bacterium]MBT7122719.1 MFS transporter [Clostridia bacterium]
MSNDKKIIAYVFSIFLFLGICLSMLQRIVSEIGSSFALSNTSVGTIITMVFVGYLISPILTGELTDKIGRKKVLLIAFSVLIGGLALVLLVDSVVAVGAGFFIIGMSFAVLELSMSSMLTDMHPNDAGKILNLSRVFFAVGTVSGPFIAMLLINTTGKWVYSMLFALVLITVLFAIFLKLSFPQTKYPNQTITKHDAPSLTLGLLKNKVVLVLCVSMIMYLAIEAGITFYVSRYIDSITDNAVFSTLTLSVFWLCMAIGRFASTLYKKDPVKLVASIAVLACIGLAVCLLVSGLAISIVSFGIMGLGCSAMFPTLLAIGKNNFPKYTNTIFGILLSAAGIGGIIQPLIMGAVADSSGLKAALATVFAPLVLLFVTQIILLVFARKNKAVPEGQAE